MLWVTYWHDGHGFLRQWLEKLGAFLGKSPQVQVFSSRTELSETATGIEKKSCQPLLTPKVSSSFSPQVLL